LVGAAGTTASLQKKPSVGLLVMLISLELHAGDSSSYYPATSIIS